MDWAQWFFPNRGEITEEGIVLYRWRTDDHLLIRFSDILSTRHMTGSRNESLWLSVDFGRGVEEISFSPTFSCYSKYFWKVRKTIEARCKESRGPAPPVLPD